MRKSPIPVIDLVLSKVQQPNCCRYCQNMECAQSALSEVGDNHPILLTCQKELGHQLPLSSYLLKPMQRLTKYQLLLKVSHLNININRPEHSPIRIFGIICILC